MLTIGLLGGIASGKSTVARLLAEHGAVVFDADRFAHEVLQEEAVQQLLVARWGAGVIKAPGELDRRQIAKRVFGDSERAIADRAYLESLVHPRVRERLRRALATAAQSGGRVAVLDIPLLIEAGWTDECDVLLFVDADRQTRLTRAAARGWDAAELAQREASQLPIEEKRARADAVVGSVGDDLAGLRRAVAEFWAAWVAPRLAEAAPRERPA